MKPHLVIHYDEIGLKKGNRSKFENILIQNIKKKVKIKKTYRERGQIVFDLDDNNKEEITELLKLTPGISSFLFCNKAKNEINDIIKKSLKVFDDTGCKSFRVDTRRHNKGFNESSNKVNIELGKAIQDKYNLDVKLKNPDKTIYVEICDKNTYIGCEKIQGIGGIGVGSADDVLSLISGGIDSPVASYMMMKRGCKVTYIHFENKTNMSKAALGKVDKLVKQLSKVQGESKLYVIPFEEIQKRIIIEIPAKYRMIIYRRFMGRIAQGIAENEKIKAIVTGDSLSQVASQTMKNMIATSEPIKEMIFSPLIGLNKVEIIDISKKIGTYDISIEPYNDCCSFFIAKNPETSAYLPKINKMESGLDIDGLVEQGIKNAKVKLIK